MRGVFSSCYVKFSWRSGFSSAHWKFFSSTYWKFFASDYWKSFSSSRWEFFSSSENCPSPAWLRWWPRLAVEESRREERRRLTTRTRALTTKTGTLTTIMVTETGKNQCYSKCCKMTIETPRRITKQEEQKVKPYLTPKYLSSSFRFEWLDLIKFDLRMRHLSAQQMIFVQDTVLLYLKIHFHCSSRQEILFWITFESKK